METSNTSGNCVSLWINCHCFFYNVHEFIYKKLIMLEFNFIRQMHDEIKYCINEILVC